MRLTILFTIFIVGFTSSMSATGDTFMDYQNYNHGYCPDCQCIPCKCEASPDAPQGNSNPYVEGQNPECNTCPKPNPCNPAPVCGTKCGFSNCTLGLIIGSVAAAAAIIVTNGFSHNSHN